MFTFGHALGSITGVLAALGVPYLLIRPQVPTCLSALRHGKAISAFNPAQKTKQVHKQEIADLAQRLYPAASLHGPRGGLRDGRSDALLLAHYGHQHLSGSSPEALIQSQKPKAKKTTTRRKKTQKTVFSDCQHCRPIKVKPLSILCASILQNEWRTRACRWNGSEALSALS